MEYIVNNQLQYDFETKSVDSLENVINKIRIDNNIVDVKYQVKELTKKTYKGKALNADENKTWEAIKTKETQINKENSKFANELSTYNYFKNEVNKFKYEYNSKISFTNVVSKPTLPDSKCYPIRSLIVAIFALSSLMIACIVILFLNSKKPKVD